MEISFIGATGTVTGSKYWIRTGSRNILVDCGLFQGLKNLRLKNWKALPVNPREIEAVVLTHAHIDHSGYIPLLVKNGFEGKIYCTSGTKELCEILLLDSGYLQEEEARYANQKGYSKHTPALPLYTQAEAESSLPHFHPMEFDREFNLGAEITCRFLPAGHILGSALVVLKIEGKTLAFSGDLGRSVDPIMLAPASIEHADYLVVESTYGNRKHDPANPEEILAGIINRTAKRGGVVVVPAFAVGRAQTLLFYVERLIRSQRIPPLPVFLDSPMAIDATQLYCRHQIEHRLSPSACEAMCRVAQFVHTPDESKALINFLGPRIIISASGMATGGRILHHLKAFAPEPQNTILLPGFQAAGTRGAALAQGADSLKIHGHHIPVRAEVVKLDNLSAHADASEILQWLGNFLKKPTRVFITHGEPEAADTLRRRISEELGWACEVPEYLQKFEL